MILTLKQLRYALALAEEGHFGRAAERCHVTQPALSQQIKLLEESCQTHLFERIGRAIRPTPFGHEFLDRAARIVKDADALQTFTANRGGKPMRPIRFGLIPTVAPYILPEIYPALQSALPDTGFAVSESHTNTLLESLEDGTLDIALIATEPPPGTRLAIAPLFADPFVLATARDDTLPDPVNLGEVPRNRVLLLDEGHCFRDQAIDACALQEAEATHAFAATSLSTIVEFVANGQGITLLPAISLKKEAADPRIRIHPLQPPGASRLLSLVWRETTPFTELFNRIAEVIQTEGEKRLVEVLPSHHSMQDQNAAPPAP